MTSAAPVVRHGSRWIEELPASPARWLLAPLWLPYRVVIAGRNAAYDLGLAPTRRLAAPVISIGNLTAGGTGKTPASLAVVAALRALGRTPAILARGYRGINGINDEAQLAGDTPVWCDPDRHASGTRALAAGADCLVLDDGFQHRRLQRDLDIVLLDATRPWGRDDGKAGAVLPLGYLREGRRALRRAGLLWLTRTDLVSPDRIAQLRRQLAGLAPIVEERTSSVTLRPLALSTGEREPVSAWHGRRVVLASGIGHPAAFAALAQAQGLQVVACHRFPDHHHFTAAEAERLNHAARAADATLVMTGKDAVKLAVFAPALGDARVLEVVSALVDDRPLRAAIAQAVQPR